MTIANSPDITSLEAQVTWDISGNLPVISLVNLSTGSGLADMQWWFTAYSPSNTPIHEGSTNNVDINGSFTTYVLADSWPKPAKAVEWSGAPYVITIYAKDTNGSVYLITKSAVICPPNGNTSLSKNAYGLANIYVKNFCDKGRVYFEDRTDSTYRGVTGTRITSVLKMAYPLDETGVAPAAFEHSPFSNAMVPITYDAPDYKFVANIVYDYDLTNYVHVRIKYAQSKVFPVLCNMNLGGVACEVIKLNDSIQNGYCGDVTEAQNKLNKITPLLLLAFIGTIEPLSGGENVSALVDQILEIGGFDCNCCNVPTGILGESASVIDGYTFSIDGVGGDIDGIVVKNGYNLQFQLHDKSYVFGIYPGSPMDTTAFSVVPSTNGYVKTYYLKVNVSQFATDLANVIKSSSSLVNLWQSIFGDSIEFNLTVDGECIFQSTSTCDYNFVLTGIPEDTTYALLNSMPLIGNPNSLSHSFNLTNLSLLQSYLNSLQEGNFVVTAPFPNPNQDVYISSTANPNPIQSLTYKISATTYIADMTRTCTGYVAIKADQVVQKIISYICNLDDNQIKTSDDYTIQYIDENGDLQTSIVDAGSSISEFIIELLARGDNTITYLKSNGGGAGTCESLQALFPVTVSNPTATDFLFGTKGNGACSRLGYLEAFNYMLQSALTNATTKELFCDMVTSCANGLTCTEDTYFETFVTEYSTTCVSALGIEYTLS